MDPKKHRKMMVFLITWKNEFKVEINLKVNQCQSMPFALSQDGGDCEGQISHDMEIAMYKCNNVPLHVIF